MSMAWDSSISFFIAIFIFGITPGPGVFAIMARALVDGTSSCLMLALGMTISDILYLIAACFGLAVIASQWSEVFTLIRILGGAYLIYLGWRMWNAPVDLQSQTNVVNGASVTFSFIQGFLISASNPKVILFYIAFLPTFMDLTSLGAGDIALVSTLTFVALMLGLMIAVFASKARAWFRSETATKRLNLSAGSIMIGAGAYLLGRH